MHFAYTRPNDGRWWIFILTPSGMTARLLISYDRKAVAEAAIGHFGYTLIEPDVAYLPEEPSHAG